MFSCAIELIGLHEETFCLFIFWIHPLSTHDPGTNQRDKYFLLFSSVPAGEFGNSKENYVFQCYYAASRGNFSPTFRDKLSVSCSWFKNLKEGK
jgi:hypothetical protein